MNFDSLLRWLFLGEGADAASHDLAQLALVAARVAPLVLMAPWLVLRGSPALVRTALTLALALAFVGVALPHAGPAPEEALSFSLALVTEASLGLLFAFALVVPFYALEDAGRLIDTWRGASMSEISSPFSAGKTTPTGQLTLLLGIVLFVSSGGQRVAFLAFAEGFQVVPIASALSWDSIAVIATGAARLVATALALSLSVAAPAGLSVVLVDLSLGLVGRAAPQIPIFFAGMPLRAAAGIFGLLLALTALLPFMQVIFGDAIVGMQAWSASVAP